MSENEPVFVDVEGQDPNRAKVARAREDEALQRLTEVEQLRQLMQIEPLRDFLWRALTHCRVFGSVWDANYGKMSFNEGGRNVGLWLLAEISEADPDALLQMQLKANRVKAEDQRTQREAAAKKPRRS